MKILLIRLRSIGDIIQCTPAFTLVRQIFNNAAIDLMIEERFSELVIENPNLDGLLLYNNNFIKFSDRLKYDISFIRMIRRRNYDIVIDFHGIPKTAIFSYLSKAKIRIGYNYKWRGSFYTHKINPPEKFKVHSAINQINLLRALPLELKPDESIFNNFIPKPLICAKNFEAELDNFLKNNQVVTNIPNHFIILYHIVPSNNFKKWPIKNYVALMNLCEHHELFKNTHFYHIIIGSKMDEVESEKLQELFKPKNGRLISACGKLSLGALYNLAKISTCFIGPDSGPLHIAAASDIPTIGIFGPTNIETFAPLSKNFVGIYNENLKCRPCDQKKCSNNFKCLTTINVSKVFNEILKILALKVSLNYN